MMDEYEFINIVMYPNLSGRREFVHKCWVIAKERENLEFKQSVAGDSSFYLTREDLLILTSTADNIMINYILELGCKLHVQENQGYKLISIKNQQLD